MYEILPWIGLGILSFLCLPIPFTRKLVLEASTWLLRLSIVGLLAVGVYLWFQPGAMPAEITRAISDRPRLQPFLPGAASPAVGLCLACWAALAFVPILAVLDVSRRLCPVRERVAAVVMVAPPPEPVLPTAEPIEEVGVPVLRPITRRTAAAALATAGTRTTP